ncbi:YheU family protein [Testudinibacter sp. TR-2022]|uniref:YheU family protein n=1 Tax=Testudinibacter sp. TR-2022 TaxID=2585029 RepID=UPI00111BC012|nr:YheU family protein [Testudinibacter sp. TR-2022]TNH05315.1 YheU family protein [Pasteurellaceae bacterium Phil31]TNH08216.1 YheU family protein [Testudinibacter sp. TR-2022]TNH11302.1 YheU family protein [Testudinibacter sp. TR-2022]TNH14327.1 YheU family protein [Testudinibacter sp. TR-2022]TNH20460.1 YheU family protein [Testudinibacter sp. TR-2022]
MIIPWQTLAAETLDNILESFVLREGTDYGAIELTLAQKKTQLRRQLEAGNAILVWSELHQSIDIKDKKLFLQAQ